MSFLLFYVVGVVSFCGFRWMGLKRKTDKNNAVAATALMLGCYLRWVGFFFILLFCVELWELVACGRFLPDRTVPCAWV
jgi:dolichyl-phosphate-mannose--protein O-mannosyl transferase